ncbi:MAG: type II toxin-antitoxin system RelE/ParE family toxin [Bacteroidia bacterium]
MSFKIVFSDWAESDFNQIASWYSSIRGGLDDEFILCLEKELEVIKRNPLLFELVFENVRKTVLYRFPYNLYYIVEENKIVVLAIAHYKRSETTVTNKLKRK